MRRDQRIVVAGGFGRGGISGSTLAPHFHDAAHKCAAFGNLPRRSVVRQVHVGARRRRGDKQIRDQSGERQCRRIRTDVAEGVLELVEAKRWVDTAKLDQIAFSRGRSARCSDKARTTHCIQLSQHTQ